MNRKQFFLHKGHARKAEICFMVVGLLLLGALGRAAMTQVAASEPIVGIQEWLWGTRSDNGISQKNRTDTDLDEKAPLSFRETAPEDAEQSPPTSTDAAKNKSIKAKNEPQPASNQSDTVRPQSPKPVTEQKSMQPNSRADR